MLVIFVERKRDWSGKFDWDDEVNRLKEDVFCIYDNFRHDQRETINASLSNRDVFVIMVNNGSLIYFLQFLAYWGRKEVPL